MKPSDLLENHGEKRMGRPRIHPDLRAARAAAATRFREKQRRAKLKAERKTKTGFAEPPENEPPSRGLPFWMAQARF